MEALKIIGAVVCIVVWGLLIKWICNNYRKACELENRERDSEI